MPTVSILDKNIEINLKENEIIYNGLEDQGVILQHGCLSGSCGACKIEILEGKENVSPIGAIESDTVSSIIEDYKKRLGEKSVEGKNIRLSCRTKITGNIKIRELTKNLT